MAPPSLNWSAAEVRKATLRVELEGELPRGWKSGFATTVRLLGGGEWGEVNLKKGVVRVAGMTPGDEEKVKHFLESVVDQANASHPGEETEPAPDQTDPDQDKDPDAEMTRRFRDLDTGGAEA